MMIALASLLHSLPRLASTSGFLVLDACPMGMA